jgi:hypothetical protein
VKLDAGQRLGTVDRLDPADLVRDGIDGNTIYDRGLHWLSLSLAAVEGPLAVVTTVWLLAVAQRRPKRDLRALSHAMARGAYGAFLLSGSSSSP